MIRGTNAQFKFEIPYDFSELTYVNIMFWQDGNDGPDVNRPLPIRKIKDDCKWYAIDKQVVVDLSPEETARFVDDRKAKVQLSATTGTGIRFASKERIITVYPMYLDDPVFGDITPPTEIKELIIADGGNIIG